jgi:hypothetical protein
MMRQRLMVTAAVTVLCASNIDAQATVPNSSPIDYSAARLEIQGAVSPPAIDYAAASREAQNTAAAETAASDDRSAIAQTDYYVWSLGYTRSTFEWQYASTIVIFIVVMLLICCGLYFSYLQFKTAARAPTTTSIKLGKDGLEINSEVIGLLILFLSVGFFYLYLANVYPISETRSVPVATSSQ